MHLGAGEGVMRTAASGAASHWRRRPHGLAFVDPDVHLVEALRQRAPGSVEALVATHAKRIYRLAIRIAGNRQDAVLTSAIAELLAAYRTTFLCRVVSGQSNSEIAEGLSISIPAVKSRLYRSRRFLQTRMSEYMTEVIA